MKQVKLLKHLGELREQNYCSFLVKQPTKEGERLIQKEAASFIDNDRLFIADERSKSIGGNVYEVSIKKLKPKS